MTPDDGYIKILETGFSFWKAQALLASVELGIHSKLAQRPMSLEELRESLKVHGRGLQDLLKVLVMLGMLEELPNGYRNTAAADYYLDDEKPTYIGGLLELAAARLYPLWGSLHQALLTGEPQNEARTEVNYYDNLCEDRDRLAKFLKGMDGISLPAAMKIAERFPWDKYQTFLDVGGARGALSIQLAGKYQHLTGGCFDLPAVGPHFDTYIRQFGLQERVRFYGGDFFRDPLPPAQVMLMGHVLHNWSPQQRRFIIQKVCDAIPLDGALIAYEWFSGEGAVAEELVPLMSLNMLLSTREGGGSSWRECQEWMLEAGFRQVTAEPLIGPCSMVIGLK